MKSYIAFRGAPRGALRDLLIRSLTQETSVRRRGGVATLPSLASRPCPPAKERFSGFWPESEAKKGFRPPPGNRTNIAEKSIRNAPKPIAEQYL